MPPPKKPSSRVTVTNLKPVRISKPIWICQKCGHNFESRKKSAPNRKCSACQSTDLQQRMAVLVA